MYNSMRIPLKESPHEFYIFFNILLLLLLHHHSTIHTETISVLAITLIEFLAFFTWDLFSTIFKIFSQIHK
jgi:cysteine/O-acetylserine efflux protein